MKDWKDIDGFLELEVGIKLQELAMSKDVFEIGCYKGKSTVCMAMTAKSVTTLDTFKADKTGQGQNEEVTTLGEFMKNIEEFDNISSIVGKSPRDIPKDKPFDLVFIDGMHGYGDVMGDFEEVKKILKPNGIIAFHDYGDGCQVQPAVDRLKKESQIVVLGRIESLLWCNLRS